MSNDDQLDQQLRRIAERSMERRPGIVDTDAALGDHRVRLERPPTADGHGRHWLAAAAAVVVLAAGITAIVWPRSAASPDLVATETVATSPPTTGTVGVTTEQSTETTTTSTSASTAASASPSTIRAGGVVEITPAGSVQRTCLDIATLTPTDSGSALTVGQIVSGDWIPAAGPGAPVTYPACEGRTSNEPVSVTVPVDVPAGEYDFCITQPGDLAGCATVTIETAATDEAGCTSEPMTPPSLVDGSRPGEGIIGEQADGRLVRWGETDSPFAVTQALGFPIDESWLDNAIADGRAITAGDWQATTVAVGDPPISEMTVFLGNTRNGCIRTYNVGPGLFSDEVSTLAENWVGSLSTGEPIAPSGHIDIGLGYYGRRYASLEPFYFEIDEIGPTGASTGTLTDDQIASLFSRNTLSDGTNVRLEGSPSENRCNNRTLVRSGAPETGGTSVAVSDARSIAATTTGTLLAIRDVCPPGSKWGDPGTFSELIELDPSAANPSVVSLRTWQSDADRIVLDDGNRVIAFGEHTLAGVSPSGQYVSLSELHENDSRRWSLLDLGDNAEAPSPPSICESAGDIVGPPRFVGNDVVVLARLCATLHTGDDTQGGDVQVEAIDLAAAQPSDSLVWNSSVPGLSVDEFTQSVDLSARRDTDNTIWAIVSGNGGFETSSQSYALSGSEIVEITRLGFQTFAFQPSDLITQFDVPPS